MTDFVHQICEDTGYCKKCGAFYDKILAENLVCIEGVRAISHIRAKEVNKGRDPFDPPILAPGARPEKWFDTHKFLTMCINDFCAKQRDPDPPLAS